MYRITKSKTQTPDSKTNIHASNSTGVESSNSVRRPKSKGTKSKNRVLKNTNRSFTYVQKISCSVSIDSNKCETKDLNVCQTNASVSNSKTVTDVNDGSNIICVSCGKDVFLLSHEKCVARYALSRNSNVKRALFTTLVAAKIKNLGTTFVVAKSRLSVANTPKATKKVIQLVLWNVDSGCSKHMTGNPQLIRNFVEKFIGIVRFRNDHFAAITGYGDYVQDLEVAFHSNMCYVRNLKGDDLLTGSLDSNLYTIFISEMAASSPVCLMSRATSIKSWLWHRRLSHLNFGTINQLTSKDLVDGLLKFKYNKDHLCSAYEQGKGKKASLSPKLVPSTESKLKLLYMNLCRPMRVASINGKKYIIVIVDDYSRYTWVYFLRTKDEAPDIIIGIGYSLKHKNKAKNDKTEHENRKSVEQKSKSKPKVKIKAKSIVHQTSIARTLQQNGVIKCQNCTLVEVARIMLIFSEAPEFLWAEAIATACFTQNRYYLHKCYRDPTQEVSDNPASNTLDNEHTSSSSSIVVEENEAPQIVSSPAEQVATEPNSLVLNANVDEFVQEDVADFDGNVFFNAPPTPVFEEAKSSLTYQDTSNMYEFHQKHRSSDRWTKNHPIKQVISDPSKPIMTRNRLQTDAKVCMYALTIFLDYRVTLGFGSTGGLDLACPIIRLSSQYGMQRVIRYVLEIVEINILPPIRFGLSQNRGMTTAHTPWNNNIFDSNDIKPDIVNPKIGDDIEFEINANYMKELRRKRFACTDGEDAYEHVRTVLEITKDALKSIQKLVEHSHKWHCEENHMTTPDPLRIITEKLKLLNHKMEGLKVDFRKLNTDDDKKSYYAEVKRRILEENKEPTTTPDKPKQQLQKVVSHEIKELPAHYSATLQNKLPPKETDPGSFIIPCIIRNHSMSNALVDLGASISVMPYSLFKRLGLGSLKPIKMTIEMADRSMQSPKEIKKCDFENYLLPEYRSQDIISLSPSELAEDKEDFSMTLCNLDKRMSIGLEEFVDIDDMWDDLDLGILSNEKAKTEFLKSGGRIHLHSPDSLQLSCKISDSYEIELGDKELVGRRR
ncbi:retrovirus-related pol polyprotein from transposon TNT 1-94 [Tanacetum coccineum]|uniref:Retrovirus-related pol polyprotein from transposon TNT 1-94 n=1 Tax=Tanacetum coccineum TaxID=301880 RepID=A0ABQ5IWT6_9ASTR